MNQDQLREFAQGKMDLKGDALAFWEACTTGDINLDWDEALFSKSFTPSPVARRSYLYPQCITASKFHSQHYTRRKDMQSYLIAQTFLGSGVLQYEGVTYALKPGDCFFIDCRKEHYYYASSSDGWGYRIIHFDGMPMADYYAHFLQCGSVKFSVSEDNRLGMLIDKLYIDNPRTQAAGEIVYSCMLTELVTQIILHTSISGYKPVPVLVEKVLDHIEKNYAGSLSLDGLAHEFYVSKYHLSREFKKYTNTSPNDYLIDTRLNAAKALLQSTDLSIGQISTQVGISSPDHFLYLFKSREGMPPSTYRRQWQNI